MLLVLKLPAKRYGELQMALSKNTVRIQITLNSSKEKDKVILDFLDGFYDPKDKIKEILYLVASNKIVSNDNQKLLTITNGDVKKTIKNSTDNEEKLLTYSNREQEKIHENEMEQLKEFM